MRELEEIPGEICRVVGFDGTAYQLTAGDEPGQVTSWPEERAHLAAEHDVVAVDVRPLAGMSPWKLAVHVTLSEGADVVFVVGA